MMALGDLQKSATKVPGWIRVGALVGATAPAAWQALFDVGIYRWVSDGQASLMQGEYYPFLSFALAWLPGLLVGLLLIQGLAMTLFKDRPEGKALNDR